jgi:hypothetical protein
MTASTVYVTVTNLTPGSECDPRWRRCWVASSRRKPRRWCCSGSRRATKRSRQGLFVFWGGGVAGRGDGQTIRWAWGCSSLFTSRAKFEAHYILAWCCDYSTSYPMTTDRRRIRLGVIRLWVVRLSTRGRRRLGTVWTTWRTSCRRWTKPRCTRWGGCASCITRRSRHTRGFSYSIFS